MWKKTAAVILMIIYALSVNVSALSAQSAVLIDAQMGRVIYEHNAYEKGAPASTTKIMTALVAIENGNLDKKVKVSKKAASVEGSSIWLAEGEKMSLKNLLYGLMLSSGNDAATAIAESVGGSEKKFVRLMNKKAKEMGLKNTHFDNPHGLSSDEHYTTAYELALIAREALKNQLFANIVSTKKQTIPWEGHTYSRSLTNHNKLLNLYDGANGVKTGYTKASGRTLVSSATRDGVQLIAVTLNAPDDWNDHKFLLDYGFERYKSKIITPIGETVRSITVENGVKKAVNAVTDRDLTAVVTEGDISKIKVKYTGLPTSLKAPVRKGTVLGKATMYYDGKEVESADIVAFESVGKQPPKTLWEKIISFFKGLFS